MVLVSAAFSVVRGVRVRRGAVNPVFEQAAGAAYALRELEERLLFVCVVQTACVRRRTLQVIHKISRCFLVNVLSVVHFDRFVDVEDVQQVEDAKVALLFACNKSHVYACSRTALKHIGNLRGRTHGLDQVTTVEDVSGKLRESQHFGVIGDGHHVPRHVRSCQLDCGSLVCARRAGRWRVWRVQLPKHGACADACRPLFIPSLSGGKMVKKVRVGCFGKGPTVKTIAASREKQVDVLDVKDIDFQDGFSWS